MDIDGVAIVGMAGRFPGAGNVAQFWENLRGGVESVSFFTDEELQRAGVDLESVRGDARYVRAQAVLDGADRFDAAFFGVNPKEAELMDPQHRLFLEACWEALEDAAYDPAAYAGSIGVYGGANKNSYLFNNVHPHHGAMEPVGVDLLELANEKDYLATRVSYKLDLRGPSVSIHTACSTSLVAVQFAYQGLLGYQCDLALAGGVCVRVPQTAGYRFQEGSILSPDGHCRPYDEQAQGTVGGSGVGIVALKRLADAQKDGDHVYAVIRGMALNNDGASKLSFSAPSVDGQANAIALAQAIAGVGPESITYVEGHGTATPLGDPIEVAALTQAFRRGTDKTGYCALGSVKSNFGHLDAAAGVAGLIKTALALHHGQIPPTVHFRAPNPRLEIESSPFYVNADLREWRSNGAPRRAGVSSFGIGGTNVHAVLEEAPRPEHREAARSSQLLIISARTEAALEETTDRLIDHLKRHPELSLADVAYSLQIGRRAFEHRRFAVCRDLRDAIACLEARDPERVFTGHAVEQPPPVGFTLEGNAPRVELEALGRRWLGGTAVDWSALHVGTEPRRVSLPTYPFERKRYWIDPPARSASSRSPEPESSLGRRWSSAQGPGRRESILAELGSIVSVKSGLDESALDGNATFVELGFDSLFLSEVSGEVQRRFPVKISFRHLFEEAPSLSALAEFIDRQLHPDESEPRASGPHAPSEASVGTTTPPPESVEWIIEQQLALMGQQLEAFRNEVHRGPVDRPVI
jgi:acyl transferase domain-containing protein